ncbi:MAG: cellulose binding domain-containing protein [Lachnospiraceae bacterium]|nr:cellulose binding domain-containing protein [Lachnospiraceae bacterium]
MNEMSYRKGIRCFFVGIIIAVLSVISSNSLHANETNYSIKFELESKWDTGFQGTIYIQNTGDSTIENWAFLMDLSNDIQDIWNAGIVEKKDGNYLIKNAGWNRKILPGGTVSFGFRAKGVYVSAPTNCALHLPERKDITENIKVENVVEQNWNNGQQGKIIITNLTNRTIEGWNLSFDYENQISDIWNAKIVNEQTGQYTICSSDYNYCIPTGKTVEIGYISSGEKEFPPANFVLSELIISEYSESGESNPHNGDSIDSYISVSMNTAGGKVFTSYHPGFSDSKIDCVQVEVYGENAESIQLEINPNPSYHHEDEDCFYGVPFDIHTEDRFEYANIKVYFSEILSPEECDDLLLAYHNESDDRLAICMDSYYDHDQGCLVYRTDHFSTWISVKWNSLMDKLKKIFGKDKENGSNTNGATSGQSSHGESNTDENNQDLVIIGNEDTSEIIDEDTNPAYYEKTTSYTQEGERIGHLFPNCDLINYPAFAIENYEKYQQGYASASAQAIVGLDELATLFFTTSHYHEEKGTTTVSSWQYLAGDLTYDLAKDIALDYSGNTNDCGFYAINDRFRYLRQINRHKKNCIAIIFTDGREKHADKTSDAYDALIKSGITIYVISVGGYEPQRIYKDVAKATGGQCFMVSGNSYNSVIKTISESYCKKYNLQPGAIPGDMSGEESSNGNGNGTGNSSGNESTDDPNMSETPSGDLLQEDFFIRLKNVGGKSWAGKSDSELKAEAKKVNLLFKQVGITDPDSAKMFLATCAYESNYGNCPRELTNSVSYHRDEFKKNKYTYDERGAGYIQLTRRDAQNRCIEFFADYFNDKGLAYTTPDELENKIRTQQKSDSSARVDFIAEVLPWESAIWYWGREPKIAGAGINSYIEKTIRTDLAASGSETEAKEGVRETIFFISQCALHGDIHDDKDGSRDDRLRRIREATRDLKYGKNERKFAEDENGTYVYLPGGALSITIEEGLHWLDRKKDYDMVMNAW